MGDNGFNRVNRVSIIFKMEELNQCKMTMSERRKLAHFLADTKIQDVSEIDYTLRVQYMNYLECYLITKKHKQAYVKAMDKAKWLGLERKAQQEQFGKRKPSYRNTKLYLPYFLDVEIAKTFYYVRNEEVLFWDFTLPVPEKLKRQIYTVLLACLYENKQRIGVRNNQFLWPLKSLYEYCVCRQLWDLQQLEEAKAAGKTMNNLQLMMEIMGVSTKEELMKMLMEEV